ncbi:hypothetical protein MYRA21_2774 [Myroides sp. A21]|uniref:hypothetical protein n=1 Tax=Myroides sp. A21 TaxID=1583100 RepID=UPI00057E2C80|nr:hypothetical protein [Myroides sp. A21]AJA69883.1 hypothetical protein MYRA21_2774 [Myroides sp. A21]
MNFQVYRYHLSPLSTEEISITIDGKSKVFTEEDLKNKKNYFFEKALEAVDYYKNSSNILKLEFQDSGIFVMKIANSKTTEIVEDFEKRMVETYPYEYILINNDDTVQRIAISTDNKAFSSANVVKNIMLKLLDKELSKYGLSVKIEAEFDEVAIWKTITIHREELKSIQIKYIKPNLANISKSLDQAFKDFSNGLNSQESTLEFKAPSEGTLENINENNTTLKGMVQYAAQGGGSVKIAIKGYTKKISSKQNPIEIEIDEVTLEGPNGKEVIDAVKNILK